MVLAAIIQNLGVYDPVTRIRKVVTRNVVFVTTDNPFFPCAGEEHLRGDEGAGDLPEEHAARHRQQDRGGEAAPRPRHRSRASHPGLHVININMYCVCVKFRSYS